MQQTRTLITGVMLSKTAKRCPRFDRARRLPGYTGGPKFNWFSNGRDGIQMESSFKAVARRRHGILPHQCGRQHFSRLAKPRYWVGNREHASGVQGGWCWRHS